MSDPREIAGAKQRKTPAFVDHFAAGVTNGHGNERISRGYEKSREPPYLLPARGLDVSVTHRIYENSRERLPARNVGTSRVPGRCVVQTAARDPAAEESCSGDPALIFGSEPQGSCSEFG